jgi:hypothetical protein
MRKRHPHKNPRDYFIGAFLIVLAVIVLWALAEGEVYEFSNASGGLQVAKDSTALAPNEAMVMDNLTLDPAGFPKAREGYSFVDSSVIKADTEIQAIYIYEPIPDTLRMVVVCGGFIYIWNDLTDPGAVDWDTLRLSFTGDSIDATNGSATITTTTGKDSWWYTNTWGDNTTGDHLIVDEDDTETEYAIQKIFQTGHNSMTITPAYAGTTGVEMNYTIYKKIHGDPYITQFRNELYICDSDGFSIIYNDTGYTFIALLDSGFITASVPLNDTVTIYSTGKTRVKHQENKVYGNNNVVWQSTWGDGTWEYTIHTRARKRQSKIYELEDISWSSKITDVDSTEKVLTLEDIYPWVPVDVWNDYEIKTIYYLCVLDSGLAVIDSNKNWMDFELGDAYLEGLRSVFGPATSYGTFNNRLIGCNSDVAFAVPKEAANAGITTDAAYYIFAGGLPYQFTSLVTDDTRMEYPRYRHIAFYNNQLFGLGYRKLVGNYTLTTKSDYDLVWYSHPSIPRYSPSLDYNFALDKNENNSVFFPIRNSLFIGTDNSIWQYSGILGQSIFSKVVSNNGIPDYNNWVKATEKYGYFVNHTGAYRFDGVEPEKISWNVDPLIRDNYGSRIVMVYQDNFLYISFTDSNFTLVYDERFGVFTSRFDFGMTCAYAPPDTNIIYFGHSEHKGQVFYYPNGKYYNQLSDTTETYSTAYESGWMADGGYWTNKIFKEGYFKINNSLTSTVKLYTDFNATPCDTLVCDSTGIFVYHKLLENDCVGEYHKIRIEGGADSSAVFGEYRLEWEIAPQPLK